MYLQLQCYLCSVHLLCTHITCGNRRNYEIIALLFLDLVPCLTMELSSVFLFVRKLWCVELVFLLAEPIFAVRMRRIGAARLKNAIVLEGVQDPGNVGTVIRTANAFGVDAVILTGACADLYNPKTVRATMGAIFRQRVLELPLAELRAALDENGLPLYGAALSETARDFREMLLDKAAVAVGSEGNGLSTELLAICDGQLIIPMRPDSESLNAGVAASVIMWEMSRGSL